MRYLFLLLLLAGCTDMPRGRHGERLRIEHDKETRQAFHDYLVDIGLSERAIPPDHMKYNSSHIQAMWDTWVAALISERRK